MKRRDQPFMVGRRNRRGMTVVYLREQAKPPFRGPWTVRVVVTPALGPAR